MRENASNIKKFAAIMKRFPVLYLRVNKREPHAWEEVAETVRCEMREDCSALEAKHFWNKLCVRYRTLFRRVCKGSNQISNAEYEFYDTYAFLFPQTAARYGHPSEVCHCHLPRPSIQTLSSDNDVEYILDTSNFIKERVITLKTKNKNAQRTNSKQITVPVFDNNLVGEPSNSGRNITTLSTLIKTEPLHNQPEVPTSSISIKKSSVPVGDTKNKNALRTYSKQITVPVFDNNLVGEPSNSGRNITELSTVIKTEPLHNQPEVPTSSISIKKSDVPVGDYLYIEDSSDSEKSVQEFSIIKTETLITDPDVPTSFIHKKKNAIPALELSGPPDTEKTTEEFSTIIKTEPVLNEPEVLTSSIYKKNNAGTSVGNHSVIEFSDPVRSPKEFGTVIKTEPLWNEINVKCSSSSINTNPNEENKNMIKVEKSRAVIESTCLAVEETEEDLDRLFLKTISSNIADFTPDEKRKFKTGVFKLIDEIAQNRNNS